MKKLLGKRALVRRTGRGFAVLALVLGVCLSPLGAQASSAGPARDTARAAAGRPDATIATVPDAPTIGVATASSNGAIVRWTAPASQGSSPITGYRVTAYFQLIFSTTITFNSTATTQFFYGLDNGTSYRFRVAAINASGTSSKSGYSNSVTPRLAYVPGAPTIGTASPGNQQATVSWSPPASDGGLPIQAYEVTTIFGGEGIAVQRFNSTATTQVVTGLTNGQTYRFSVAAVNDVGTGPSSNPSNEVTPGAVPGPPTIGEAAASNQSATVTWTAPASDGGLPITAYVVTPYIGATAQTPRTFNSTATSQVVTGLTNGTTYTFRVAAINASGTGPASNPSNAVTPAPLSVPGPPTIGAVTRGNTQVTVNWTAPASNGGLPITAYVVTPYIGATAQTPRTFNSTATSQVVTGLTNGTTYTFRVAAINSLGTGPVSSNSAEITPGTLPGAPTIGTATPGNASVTLTWTAPASNGGLPITGYVVTPYIGAVTLPTVTFNSPAVSQVITGLINGAPYRFTVAAINDAGTGPASAQSNTVNPAAPTVPGAPTIGTAVAENAQATLSWTAPASDGGSPITGYRVTPLVGDSPQGAQTFNSTETQQVITELENGVTYTFVVQAINGVGTGAPSEQSNPVTPAAAGTVSGTVRDAGNQPVKGVVVQVPGYPSATTDQNGNYAVPGVAFGSYTVQAEGICRAPVSQPLTVQGDTVLDLAVGGFITACSVDAQVWDATTTVLPLTTSDTATAVALPFTVTRNGTPRTTAYVSSNGVVNFLGLETSSANTAIPNAAAPNDAIYGFWDHLLLDGSSTVLANTFGTAPNRRFVIEYRNVAVFDDPSVRFSFQVVLYEDPNQRIRLQYKGNVAGTLSSGTSATVGHENAAGNSAQQVSFNKGLLYDGLSVRPK